MQNCKYCGTSIDVEKGHYAIDRTMDLEPPAHVVWFKRDPDTQTVDFNIVLHQCRKGVSSDSH